jgi:excisionase family DNA binding protein
MSAARRAAFAAAAPETTTAGVLRDHLAAALASAMRRAEPESIAITADRTKALAVALTGLADDAPVQVGGLQVGTRQAAIILGFHPEHVRRLIRSGRLRASRVGGDYRVSLDDIWPWLEVRYREPGRRRIKRR